MFLICSHHQERDGYVLSSAHSHITLHAIPMSFWGCHSSPQVTPVGTSDCWLPLARTLQQALSRQTCLKRPPCRHRSLSWWRMLMPSTLRISLECS